MARFGVSARPGWSVNRRLTGNTGRSKVLVRKTRSARTLGHDNGGMFGLGNRLNNPSPTEIAILIDRPSSATTSRDFYPPLIVISRDCECVRDNTCHHRSTKHSTEKYVYHFFHIPFLVIVAGLQCGLAFFRYILNGTLICTSTNLLRRIDMLVRVIDR